MYIQDLQDNNARRGPMTGKTAIITILALLSDARNYRLSMLDDIFIFRYILIYFRDSLAMGRPHKTLSNCI